MIGSPSTAPAAERIALGHPVDRRQKPVWQRIRKPMPPPGKPQTTRKGKKGYSRKDQGWKKEN